MVAFIVYEQYQYWKLVLWYSVQYLCKFFSQLKNEFSGYSRKRQKDCFLVTLHTPPGINLFDFCPFTPLPILAKTILYKYLYVVFGTSILSSFVSICFNYRMESARRACPRMKEWCHVIGNCLSCQPEYSGDSAGLQDSGTQDTINNNNTICILKAKTAYHNLFYKILSIIPCSKFCFDKFSFK